MMNDVTIERLRVAALRTDRRYIAALELLLWLGKSIPTVPAAFYPDQIRIDPEQLAYNAGAWSGGERRVVAVALSLLGHTPVDLEDALGGLGGEHLRAVVDAVAAAAGYPSRFTR